MSFITTCLFSLFVHPEWLQWETWSPSLPIHSLAWSRGARTPHPIPGLPSPGQSLQPSRRRTDGCPLQVSQYFCSTHSFPITDWTKKLLISIQRSQKESNLILKILMCNLGFFLAVFGKKCGKINSQSQAIGLRSFLTKTGLICHGSNLKPPSLPFTPAYFC